MKQAERDELLLRQTLAFERVAATIKEATERPMREQREREAKAAFPAPRDFLAGEHGLRTMIDAVPTFGALWQKVVPPEYVDAVCDVERRREWPLLRCVCGASTVLNDSEPMPCQAECGRWFLALSSGVRVHHFPTDMEAQAA